MMIKLIKIDQITVIKNKNYVINPLVLRLTSARVHIQLQNTNKEIL
jgi:hypothetical protein